MVSDRASFQSTIWSVVLQARDLDDTGRQEALGRLCQAYWPPLYAYLRRKGYAPHDAEDLIQGFFAHLLGKNLMSQVDPDRGRFRNYLLGVLRNYVGNEIQHDRRLKRGGDAPRLSLDSARAEAEHAAAADASATPEAAYRRAWAVSVLDQAYRRLKDSLAAAYGDDVAGLLRAHLAAEPDRASYEELARRTGRSVTAITNLLHAARRNLRRHLRSVLRETVETESEVDEEIRDLFTWS